MDAAPFASEAWFERARACTAELPERAGIGWRLQFASGGTRWHQVVEDGRVVAWQPGDLDGAELELRFEPEVARAVHRGDCTGTEALEGLRIGLPDGTEGAPSPLDIADTAELADLPTLPGATLTIQYEFPAGPFGTVLHWMAFEDGRSSGLGLGRVAEPDVEVAITFSKMIGVRTGELTILECLEDGGRVDGPVGALLLLAGIEESPELHAAELACGPSGPVLARMGQLAATPEHRAAMAALADATA